MDRVELGIKLEQIDKLMSKKEYSQAAKVADTVEWRKVKKWSELTVAEEVYEKAGRPKDARNICVYAYNRNLGGRRLLYMLTDLSIEIEDLEEADELYKEYIEAAPRDTGKYVLLYKLNKARGASIERLIEILEEYKENELEERYEYELAELYAKAGRIEECVKECDDLILWFNEGEYVEKALRLKKEHAGLTRAQEAKLHTMEEFRAAGMEYEVYKPEDTEPVVKNEQPEPQPEPAAFAEVQNTKPEADEKVKEAEPEINVPEKDYSIYDTQNIQAELAKSMAIIMANLNESDSEKNNIETPVPEEQTEEPQPEIKEAEEAGMAKEPASEVIEEPASELINDTQIDEVSDELPFAADLIDEVDEPTKEIRINTHHWNRYVSVMEPEGTETDNDMHPSPGIAPNLPGPDDVVLPKYLVTKSIVEAEAMTEPHVEISGLVASVVDESEEDIIQHMNFAGHIAGQADKSGSEEDTGFQADAILLVKTDLDTRVRASVVAAKEAMLKAREEAIKEEAMRLAQQPAVEKQETAETEKEAEPNAIDGQIGLLDWLNTVDVSEAATATEPVTDEITAEEAAINALEEQLREAVRADLEERAAAAEIVPDEAPVEESIEDTREINISAEEGVAEENDDEEDYFLDASERKYLKKYLFMKGMEESVSELLKGKKKEVPDGTSSYGNIAIRGKGDTDKTGFAINLFKALHANDDQRQLKVAKTTAAILNKKGIAASIEKIKGTTLIVEHAGQLTKETVKELTEFMQGDTDNMLVIFTGEEYAISRLMLDNQVLANMFQYKIDLKHYSVNELVAIAKEYARVKGYTIEDKALLKVYLMFSELEGDDSGSEMDQVKAIIDRAIEKCSKKGRGLFGKKSGSVTPLKEKYFD